MNKDLRYNRIALWLCAIACCSWSYVLALKYYRLGYTSWDLPLYAHLMWHLCHGSMSTGLYGGNFLIDHFNGMAFLLVPFYFFFQSAVTMLYFKLFAFFAGAYIFYLLAAKRLGASWAIALMLAYMFYPANVAMLFFEFNFENLALPLIFLALYYFEERKYLSFMACCFLLTTVKENMPLVVLMFGIYGILTRREDWQRWGLYPLLLGIGMFIGEVFVLIPWLRHHLGFRLANAHMDLYSNLGDTPLEMVQTFIFNWPEVFRIMFNRQNLTFLSQLFGPLLIPALLAPRILLLAAPLFLQNLLSRFSGQQSIDYFYSSTLAVFIFMATIEFLGWYRFKFKNHLLFLIIGLIFLYDLGHVPQWIRRVTPYEEKQAVSQYILSQIPPDAKVISSNKFLYMLSQRQDLYAILKHSVFLSPKGIIPDDVDYMAVDFSSWLDHEGYIAKILCQGHWKVQAAADEVVLLKKNAARGERLINTGRHSLLGPLKSLEPAIMVDDELKMEGLDVPMSLKFGQRIMRVVYYWKALERDSNKNLPQITLSIFQGERRFYSKDTTPFYGLPVSKGRYYMQVFYYLIPKLSPGNYIVVVSSIPSTRQTPIQPQRPDLCIKNISVLLN